VNISTATWVLQLVYVIRKNSLNSVAGFTKGREVYSDCVRIRFQSVNQARLSAIEVIKLN